MRSRIAAILCSLIACLLPTDAIEYLRGNLFKWADRGRFEYAGFGIRVVIYPVLCCIT